MDMLQWNTHIFQVIYMYASFYCRVSDNTRPHPICPIPKACLGRTGSALWESFGCEVR